LYQTSFKGNVMNAPSDFSAGTTADIHRLHDLALRRAHELRQEAKDDFWRGADAVLTVTADAAERSARRLAQRLSQHARGRAKTLESLSTHTKAD
jgi:hypothetical protein